MTRHLENLLLNRSKFRYDKVWAFKVHVDINGFVASNGILDECPTNFISFSYSLFGEFYSILKCHRPCLEEADDLWNSVLERK